VATGRVCRLQSPSEIDRFETGAVLVTTNTDPDWVPIMKHASAIVTDHGGRTSHAAIISRELGLPAVVGTGNSTHVLQQGSEITVSCIGGDQGVIYEGIADVEVEELHLDDLMPTRIEVMLNLADPATAFTWWRLPAAGVGLARTEFIVANHVRVHPIALIHPEQVTDRRARREIKRLIQGHLDGKSYFIETLSQGVARIAASQYPRPVIVRMSDFKTNEYARLIGGATFEPAEENPMLGWRGASRYYSEGYRKGFGLECEAMRIVRERIGLDNVIIMIPFCRTPGEADQVLAVLAENGLKRGEKGLQVYVMCEIPSNIILADEFAQRFDGFSIGSNDLTQLVLGVDRDSTTLAALFSEEDPAVEAMISSVIRAAHRNGRKIGLCGQAPSDRPEFAEFLVRAGINSISVTPDSFVRVKQHVAAAESQTRNHSRGLV
jgi:pyruvate,water dikinase